MVIDGEYAKPDAERDHELIEKKREEKKKVGEQLQKLNKTFHFYETCGDEPIDNGKHEDVDTELFTGTCFVCFKT